MNTKLIQQWLRIVVVILLTNAGYGQTRLPDNAIGKPNILEEANRSTNQVEKVLKLDLIPGCSSRREAIGYELIAAAI